MYLVFDVGGTFIKYALMTGEGEIIDKHKIPTPVKPGEGVENFVDAIGGIYDHYRGSHDITGIAMDLPGQIDVEKGIVYGGGGVKYLDGVTLGPLISARCDSIPVALENDGKCAALAEVWKGNASDCQDAYVIIFGTGIGGGFVKDKHIHRGKSLVAGEISYTISTITRQQLSSIKKAEEIKGVNETIDQMPFIWSATKATYGMCYHIAKLKNMNPDEVNGELIYKWAADGDTMIQDILEDWYLDIARQCCNLYVICNPEVILIGGGISAQPLFIEGIKRYVAQLQNMSNVFNNMRVEPCKFMNDSNLLGALYNYKQLYEEA